MTSRFVAAVARRWFMIPLTKAPSRSSPVTLRFCHGPAGTWSESPRFPGLSPGQQGWTAETRRGRRHGHRSRGAMVWDSLGRESEVANPRFHLESRSDDGRLGAGEHPSSLRDLPRLLSTQTWDLRPRLSLIAAPRLTSPGSRCWQSDSLFNLGSGDLSTEPMSRGTAPSRSSSVTLRGCHRPAGT